VRIQVNLNGRALRRWHLELLQALDEQVGADVTVFFSDHEDTPIALERLFAFERLVHRLPRGRSALVPREAFAWQNGSDSQSPPDRILDLTETSPKPGAPRTWQLQFDGVPGEAAAVSLLLNGASPLTTVRDIEHDTVIASGRPGSENPGVVTAAFEDLLAGCITLIRSALEGRGSTTLTCTAEAPASPTPGRLVKHGSKALVRATLHKVYRTMYRAPHWRVGWRFVDGPDSIDCLRHPPSGWHDLPDDGFHFYADPFPIEVEGVPYLFVEDFDHRVGRGVISMVPFDQSGPVGTPRPVLTHDVHLSYPFVLEDEGDYWMIPETSGAKTVELYRAVRFPDRWTRERILLDGIEASDVTPFRHEGRWWLSATVRTGGSFSDALYLWSADRLQGPWRAHQKNPVLLDISAARPAGRVVTRHDRLIRPAQDGRRGYGAALTLAEITRLDDDGFEQRVVGDLAPGLLWPGQRLHTLNRAGRLEVIDGSALSPRWSLSNR